MATPTNRRNFDPHHLNIDTVEVDTPQGRIDVRILATPRTCYWAILRFMYANPNRPVLADDLCEGVRQIMLTHDAMKWHRFETKPVHKTVVDGKVVEQSTQPWKDRLITNARNLCRLGGSAAYGRRLIEMGHVLRAETKDGRVYFTLSTTLTLENVAAQKRGRKSRK